MQRLLGRTKLGELIDRDLKTQNQNAAVQKLQRPGACCLSLLFPIDLAAKIPEKRKG